MGEPGRCDEHESTCGSWIDYKEDACDAYMVETGCEWTLDYTCPGQRPTMQTVNPARDDGTLGYDCCCRQKLWKQAGNCFQYMAEIGCNWTHQYSCPQQKLGSSGRANDDRTVGYACCCSKGLWQQA